MDILMEEAIRDFIQDTKNAGTKRPATLLALQQDLKAFAAWAQSQELSYTSSIGVLDVQLYMEDFLESHAASSANRMLSSLKTFLDYCALQYGHENPARRIKGYKKKEHLPVFAQEEQLKTLFSSFGTSDQDLFEKAIMQLLYASGLRVSELCSLQLQNLHANQCLVQVQGKGDKQRMVPVAKAGMDSVVEYLRQVRPYWNVHRLPYVFVNAKGRALSRQYVHGLIQKYVQACSLPEGFSAHAFRHSCASHLLDHGADLRTVQEFLGHANISTTQIYTHIQSEHLKKGYDACFRQIKAGKEDE